MPDFQLVEGQGFTVRCWQEQQHCFCFLLPTDRGAASALSTIGVFISQVKRGRRPLGSLGWTLLLLIAGLSLGALLSTVMAPMRCRCRRAVASTARSGGASGGSSISGLSLKSRGSGPAVLLR